MPQSFVKHHQPSRILRCGSTITAPPEITDTVGEEEVQSDPRQVDPCASTSTAVYLTRLAAITGHGSLVIPFNDCILASHPWVRATATSTSTERFAPIRAHTRVAPAPARSNVGISRFSAFR